MNYLEWDADKERKNIRKHGISFSEAVTALEDEQAITGGYIYIPRRDGTDNLDTESHCNRTRSL